MQSLKHTNHTRGPLEDTICELSAPTPPSARDESIRLIARLVGDAGVQSFLRCRQPALGDRTGADLLQNDPSELLRRLRLIADDHVGFNDDLVGDPTVERFARPLKKSKGNRVLALLDELDRSEHE